MKSSHFRPLTLLSMAVTALLSVQSAGAANSQEVYAKAGLLGVGVGYTYNINDTFGLRADISTIGSFNRDGKAGALNYDADMKANQFGAYADWFPFAGGFHVSAGVHQRKLEIGVNGRAGSDGQITIGDITLPGVSLNDSVLGRVKWPTTVPYLGIGWGHGVQQGKGFGFIADVGVSFGAPSTELTVSDSLREKLGSASSIIGISVDNEIEKQRRELADDLEKLTVFPQVYLGVSYRF